MLHRMIDVEDHQLHFTNPWIDRYISRISCLRGSTLLLHKHMHTRSCTNGGNVYIGTDGSWIVFRWRMLLVFELIIMIHAVHIHVGNVRRLRTIRMDATRY